MRVDLERAYPVVQMMCEGIGVRAIERLTGLNRRTVLGILEMAGRKCEQLFDAKVRGLNVKQIEIDEAYAFVGCLEQNVRDQNDYQRGEQYAFLAVDPESKFILHTHIGKRDAYSGEIFLSGLKPRLAGRVQITSDAFPGYSGYNPSASNSMWPLQCWQGHITFIIQWVLAD